MTGAQTPLPIRARAPRAAAALRALAALMTLTLATGFGPLRAVRPSAGASAVRLAMAKGDTSRGLSVKADLLTADEEILLARQIQMVARLEDARDTLAEELGRMPTVEEWSAEVGHDDGGKKLHSIMHRGRLAKRAMVNANLRLVMSVARKYRHAGANYQDLVQEGTFGLMKAAERFDPEKGFKFSTYATWWIRQTVLRYVHDHSRSIRLPVHVHELLNRMKRVSAELKAELDRDPTELEVAERLELPIEKIRAARKAGMEPLSMDQTSSLAKKSGSGSFQTTVGETLPEEELPEPEEAADSHLMDDALTGLLGSLSPREACIVKLRFGLNDGQTRTLEEIGQMMSITRERVRQIESRALHKLRQPFRNHRLKGHMPGEEDLGVADAALAHLESVSDEVRGASAGEVQAKMSDLDRLLARPRASTSEETLNMVAERYTDKDTASAAAKLAGLSSAELSAMAAKNGGRGKGGKAAGMSAAKTKAEVARSTRVKKMMQDIEAMRSKEKEAAGARPAASIAAQTSSPAVAAAIAAQAPAADWEAQQRRSLAAAATKAVAEARKQRQAASTGMNIKDANNGGDAGFSRVMQDAHLYNKITAGNQTVAGGRRRAA